MNHLMTSLTSKSQRQKNRFNCDYCAHGDDIPINSEGKLVGGELLESGRMKIIKRTEGISTTDIVGRLLLKQKTFEQPRKLSDPGKPMLSG